MKFFATVATHEQPFDRFIALIEELAKTRANDEFTVQYGYSREPQGSNIFSKKFFAYDEMQKNYKSADCVITHAGPASIFDALDLGIKPIVVPRYKKLGEHVNNHQVEFTNFLVKNNYGIVPIYINDKLDNKKISFFVKSKVSQNHSNSDKFNDKLQEIITNLI